MTSIHATYATWPACRTPSFEARPGVVIHMAAQSVVRASYDDPVETYSTNVMGTVNVLEAVRRAGRTCAVVNVTSDKCYENREQSRGYREEDRLGGTTPIRTARPAPSW